MNIQYIKDSNGEKTGVFIPISEWNKLKEILEDATGETIEAPSKEAIKENLMEALEQVKLHKEGKIKLKSAKELLDEL